ncbi:MAG: hypothetical protein ACPGVG_20195, partial [Mycobacterium sp.]
MKDDSLLEEFLEKKWEYLSALPGTPETKIVTAVLDNLHGRRGLRNALDDIQYATMFEMLEELVEVVREA